MPIIKGDSDDDMYGGSDSSPPDKPASRKREVATEDSETAILPKSILLGREINPGDKVILRVLEMGDEDFTVSYKKDDKDDDDSDDTDDKESDTVPDEEVVVDEMDSIFS